MKHNKNLEQRTFLQDRFEILIKKQKKGNATFNELTELDEIVNANAMIRQKIMLEMQEFDDSSNQELKKDIVITTQKQSNSLLNLVKAIISRVFILKSSYQVPFLCVT